MKKNGGVYVISASSGTGKDTVCRCLTERYQNLVIAPSVTTRKRRADDNQLCGKIYTFVSEQEFEEMIKEDVFLEYDRFSEHYYGTQKKEVLGLIENGCKVIMILDVDGGLEIKEKFPESVLIFLKAPSIETLEERLINRGSDKQEEIEKRLKQVDYEYAMSNHYDYRITNYNLEETVQEAAKIIFGENESEYLK